jgi:hypothetical protein
MKLAFALWTRIAVQQLSKQLWSIDMPIRNVGEYLNRWDFTPQKPLKKNYKQNPKAVKAWLDNDYPEFTVKSSGVTRSSGATQTQPDQGSGDPGRKTTTLLSAKRSISKTSCHESLNRVMAEQSPSVF